MAFQVAKNILGFWNLLLCKLVCLVTVCTNKCISTSLYSKDLNTRVSTLDVQICFVTWCVWSLSVPTNRVLGQAGVSVLTNIYKVLCIRNTWTLSLKMFNFAKVWGSPAVFLTNLTVWPVCAFGSIIQCPLSFSMCLLVPVPDCQCLAWPPNRLVQAVGHNSLYKGTIGDSRWGMTGRSQDRECFGLQEVAYVNKI